MNPLILMRWWVACILAIAFLARTIDLVQADQFGGGFHSAKDYLAATPPTSSGANGYTGPGDVSGVGATNFYSFRCYNAATATGSTNVVNLTRASDSTSQNFKCLSNGSFDTASAATFCNGTTCTGYFLDQVGSLPLGNDFTSAFPIYVANFTNGQPCFEASSSSAFMASTGNLIPVSGNVSLGAIAQRNSSTTASNLLVENGTGNNRIIWRSVASSVQLSGGTSGAINETMSDGSPHFVAGVVTGAATSNIYVDGAGGTATTVSGNTTAGHVNLQSGPSTGTDVWVCEAIVADNVTWGSTTLFNLHSNESSFFGTP